MFQIKQNEATAVRRRIPILLVDITDGFTPETGITAPTVNISKNGATVASGAGTFAEIGNGQYYYEFTAGEVDTLGWICVNAEKATVSRDYNAVVQVMAYDAMDVVRLGLTSIPNVAQGTTGSISTGNATGQVTVATNNDKTGYALSGTQTFNVTGNITGNVSGSVGSVTGAVGSVTGNVGGNVTGSVGSLTATAVQNVWDDLTVNNTVVGSVGKLVVDNLNATVSSRATDATVWTNATRTLTAGTNIVLAKGTGITGFNDITTANIWSEALPGTYTSGQAGFKLNAAGSAADPWSTALPGVYSAGSAGNIIGNMVANTWAAGTRTLTSGANIVLAKGTGITGFNDITALSVWDVLASTVSVVGSMGLQLKTNVDATVSSRSTLTAANVWTTDVSAFVTAGQAGTFQKNTDVLTSSRMATFTYTAPLTAGATASAVWDALLASYSVNNSFGQRVLRGSTAQAACAVTGSGHIAADVHEFQPAVITAGDFAANAIDANALATSAVTEIQTGLATSTAVSGISTVTTKLDTAMQLDGAVYQFTVNALELAPSGGGGGGTTATVAMGPFIIKEAENNGSIDIQQGASHSVALQLADANGAGVVITGSTVTVRVYNSAGTLTATYSGTIQYGATGWLTFPIATDVTATPGTYSLTVTRSTSATDVQVFGPARLYVRSL